MRVTLQAPVAKGLITILSSQRGQHPCRRPAQLAGVRLTQAGHDLVERNVCQDG